MSFIPGPSLLFILVILDLSTKLVKLMFCTKNGRGGKKDLEVKKTGLV